MKRSKIQVGIEMLESREVMSADLLSNGTWSIVGTTANDTIRVALHQYDSTVLTAKINGRVIDEQYVVDVGRIQISGGRGNDRIELDPSAGAIAISAILSGGDGDDILVGGSGADILIGGAGNDQLFGFSGNDILFGDAGNDRLDGGADKDLLNGGLGGNQLVADSGDATHVKIRVPAEWEPHAATWMQWPKGEEVSYRENFSGIIRALQAKERVNLVVESPTAQSDAARFLEQRGVPLNNIQFHIMPYDWSWMRDNGAIWIEQTDLNGQKSLAVQDWGFDGWGGDGGSSIKDDVVPGKVAAIAGVPIETIPVVLEKGTLEFNGKDTVITSWTVLHQRNPLLSRSQLDLILKAKFGVSKVIWLEGAPQGDLTDGHVDGIARFVNATTVVVGRYTNPNDPDAAVFEKAATTIRAAGFNVVRMDIPGYVQYRGESLPANYLNYLVANEVVIASSYNNSQFDTAARQQLQQLFPGRTIVLTDTRELWYNGGAVHCVTNDQPILR